MGDWADPELVEVPPPDAGAKDRPVILIGDVVCTLLQDETPSEPVQITTHPIEFGSEMADFAIDLPKTLALTCKFLSDPVTAGVNRVAAENTIGRPLSTWQEKRDAILDYKRTHTPIIVSTGDRNYENMVINDYAQVRRPETSECWSVTLFFQQVEFVNQEWAAVPIESIPVTKRKKKHEDAAKKGAAEEDLGEKAGKDVTDEDERRSFLRYLANAAKGGS